MGRTKVSIESRIDDLIRSHPELKRNKRVIHCTVCSNVPINYSESTISNRIKDHLTTKSHKKNMEKGPTQKTLIQVVDSMDKVNGFWDRLTRAFIAADIPLEKLHNEQLKQFLADETGQKIPEPSTLRNNYVIKQSGMIIEAIRRRIGNSNVYFVIDETTDPKVRYCINVMVGPLDGGKHEAKLLNVEFTEKTDNKAIQDAIKHAAKILWPGECEFSKLHLILSDQASYMVLAIEELKRKSISFPNINHISCLAHAVHLVAGEIQAKYTLLNQFMCGIKKFLLKSPKRMLHFKNQTGLALPPVPIKTRWGTWLKTAEFYIKNYDKVKEFVLEYVPDTKSAAFDTLKSICSGVNQIVEKQLFEIKQFLQIPAAITLLETRNLTMAEQLSVIDGVKEVIKGHKILEFKLEESLRKNPDLISWTSTKNLSEKIERQYCPLVSVEVERSFSKYKNLLSPKRQNLTEENIKHLMLIHCNQFLY